MAEVIDIGATGGYSELAGYGIMDAAGTTVPTDGALGYGHGCLFRKANGSGATDALYVNIGTKASADFDIVNPSLIPLLDLSALAATAAEINRVADVSTRIVDLSGSTDITIATHEGKVLTLSGSGAAYTQTLPAPTGSGARFFFLVTVVNTSNHVIYSSNASIAFVGNVITNSMGDTPDLAQPWPSTAAATITLNGTTTGGAQVGDWIEVIDIAADAYFVRGVTTSSGVVATPFS